MAGPWDRPDPTVEVWDFRWRQRTDRTKSCGSRGLLRAIEVRRILLVPLLETPPFDWVQGRRNCREPARSTVPWCRPFSLPLRWVASTLLLSTHPEAASGRQASRSECRGSAHAKMRSLSFWTEALKRRDGASVICALGWRRGPRSKGREALWPRSKGGRHCTDWS